MTERLSDASLAALEPRIARPSYDRGSLRHGIVHLGVGAFHRAHQAVYTEIVLNGGDTAWGIVGVSLRSPDTRDALAPQDGLYTVAVRDATGESLQVVGAISSLLVAPESPDAVLDALSAPDTRIVSLTVTEKGYCHKPATGELDEANADIVHDLAAPATPKSAIGYLVEAIARRRAAGLAPFTVLSCDNLPSNGETVRRVVMRFAEIRDPELAAYIGGAVTFPSTMVDRIVPATTDADRQTVADALGLVDAWPIATEPFSQWVVEDRFASGRPTWEDAGVTFVDDVEPFELMKLRLLNGSHSTLAYLGYLAGHETVHATMMAPGFDALVLGLMEEEAIPTLPPIAGFDMRAYGGDLRDRFRNPALKHRTWQIAMDGSQKIPQRLLNTIRACRKAGLGHERLSLGVAAWMRYVMGTDEQGRPIDVRDPLAERIKAGLAGKSSAQDVAEALFGLGIFGDDLPADRGFVESLTAQLERLMRDGAAKVAAGFA
ncbi:mannitol dehydrogenase family protein [Aureimonas altamirensis]|uniref:mannitol dehydrogenase family protein n=1 Tax=Aureimonas altamirensis TaxID=370622 RepID=UPI001E655C1E|nr:mannitol dehydrogenase family protein [Aureimonas altamirensis]UHD44894.1 mannitol dehydrogenase family protein [Aureimonas altamirensis]